MIKRSFCKEDNRVNAEKYIHLVVQNPPPPPPLSRLIYNNFISFAFFVLGEP